MIKMRELSRKIIFVIVALFIAIPGFADTGDIGLYGRWATEENLTLVKNTITDEVTHFAPLDTVINDDFVPIEAKLGLAFMGGMAKVGAALDISLVRFAILFMLIAYAFWVSFEAYNLILAKETVKKTVKNIVIKGMWIAIWISVLNFGVAQIFTMVMTPVISLGTFIAHTILDGITSVTGQHLINNCAAIKQYAAENLSYTTGAEVIPGTLESLKISSESAAELLCMPTQMSAFFTTIIKIGWQWIFSSIGFSLFSAVLGILIIYLALKNIWKYLFIALDVIADLFLGMLLLPFTAIAETTAKTKYSGVAGDLFNSFLVIFKAEDLKTQINRIIKACLYFICLAITVGVSLSLLTFIIDPTTGRLIDFNHGIDDTIVLILILLLICYMLDKAKSLADKWAGKIDAGFGTQLQQDVTKLWKISVGYWNKIRNKKNGDSADAGGSGSSGGAGGTGGSSGSSGSNSSNNNGTDIETDVVLLGSPGVGKSSLFSVLSSRRLTPTTAAPLPRNLRYGLMYTSKGGFVLCDIPGITNTSSLSSYKEYIKTAKLAVIVISAFESDWVSEYQSVYNTANSSIGLGSTPIVIAVNKIDTIDSTTADTRKNALQSYVGNSTNVVTVSAIYNTDINQLIDAIKNTIR